MINGITFWARFCKIPVNLKKNKVYIYSTITVVQPCVGGWVGFSLGRMLHYQRTKIKNSSHIFLGLQRASRGIPSQKTKYIPSG